MAFEIWNRRFMGNKHKLIDFIDDVVTQNCPDAKSIFDVFAGTGVVGNHFKTKMKVISNDLLYCNYIVNYAFLAKERIDEEKIQNYVDTYNNVSVKDLKPNYMDLTFGNTYFSVDDCRKIGFIRENIESEYSCKKINKRERAILITILLFSMDRIANTVGHYDAYRRNNDFRGSLVLEPLDLSVKARFQNKIYNCDSNKLILEKDFPVVDVVYCDPPYNSRNYCDTYHVLENVAKWEKPEVFGVAKKMNRDNIKSRYCGKSAALAFADLICNLKCKCIVLSYNNTEDKANARSNACMTDDEILAILRKKGIVSVYSKKHRAFTTGKSQNEDNEERLFVCNVFPHLQTANSDYIKSPLNYTGGKFRLLKQILPLFPAEIKTFIDIFAGAGNVGINVTAQKVIYNDNNKDLVGLLNLIKTKSYDELFVMVQNVINKYNLSDSAKFGYVYYHCNSADGLGTYNSNRYKELRDDFNKLNGDRQNGEHSLLLFVLLAYAFNNTLRFNAKGEFNTPVGKRDFNDTMRRNLQRFSNALHTQNSTLKCSDFRKFDLTKYGDQDLIYCDPPYLLGLASYNEQNGWTEKDDIDLMSFLDEADDRGIKFAFSNVFEHKGVQNIRLMKWAKKNQYRVHYLNYDYKNSSYHGKSRDKETVEVLITNY